MDTLKYLFGLFFLLVLVVGLVWGVSGIVNGFHGLEMSQDALSDFNLAVFITGNILGVVYYVLRGSASQRNRALALVILILNIVISITLAHLGPVADIAPLVFYGLCFFFELVTAFLVGYYI